MSQKLTIHTIAGVPVVKADDDLAEMISAALSVQNMVLQDGDIVVLAQKIVSLAEGRKVDLDDVTVSAEAAELAAQTEKDPRLVELMLQESEEVVRSKPGVVITRHRLGLVGANAGIDQSNIDHEDGDYALLLPEDPDQSARTLREALRTLTGRNVGVVICDSMNRPWRLGTIGTAIGSAGIDVLDDRRGDPDLYGRELKVTLSNRADAIAAAAVLIMGEASERMPAVILRGFPADDSTQIARDCVRPLADDLFL